MKSRTGTLLKILHVLAWISFIGLLVKAGAILFSYFVSIANVEGSKNLYNGLNLHNLRQHDFGHYTAVVSLLAALELLKAYVAWLVIKVLGTIKLASPFTVEVSNLLEKIAYYIFGTWVLAVLFNAHIKWLSKSIDGLREHMISEEFILLAGVVFVFSQIFKKGVELQQENEMTV